MSEGFHIDFAKYLINNGADITKKNKRGLSIVHYVSGCKYFKIALDYAGEYAMGENHTSINYKKYLHFVPNQI